MTQEEKQLLIKDLCGRLPYGVKFALSGNGIYTMKGIDLIVTDDGDWEYAVTAKGIEPIEIKYVKPHLRPMSSMTEEEKKVVCSMNMISDTELNDRLNYQRMYVQNYTIETFDYFNERKLDYRGLIPMGLALEAPEGMYE